MPRCASGARAVHDGAGAANSTDAFVLVSGLRGTARYLANTPGGVDAEGVRGSNPLPPTNNSAGQRVDARVAGPRILSELSAQVRVNRGVAYVVPKQLGNGRRGSHSPWTPCVRS